MSYIKLINDMRWSFSRLHAYEQCPYLFYLKYIEKRDGESNYYAENGSCMHEVFEALLSDEITVDECPEFYNQRYDLICETTKQSTMDSTYEKCIDYLCEIENIDKDRYEVLGVELKLEFKICKYNFVGFVDLLLKDKKNNEILLIDHKQANHFLKKDGTPLKNQLENFLSYKKQMYIYCKGIEDKWGLKVDKIIWHHFKDDGKTTVIPFNKEDYDKSIQWVVDTISCIKKDKIFECKKSFLMCSTLCDYRNDCEYKDEEDEV